MTSLNWNKLKRFLPDGFIVGIFFMISLGWFYPGVGDSGDTIELKTIIRYGISLLFFLYGLRLSPKKLIGDLRNWKLHVTIQAITFLLFPLLLLIVWPIFKGGEYEVLWMAVFFLAVLPSTVSSSVVMVSIAGGNIPSAIFNASVSGVLGILVTPLWMGLFVAGKGDVFDFSEVIIDLVLQILLPLIIGLILHRFWGSWAIHNKRYIGLYDKSVILSIVYRSFGDSFTNGIFNTINIYDLLVLSSAIIILFFIVFESGKGLSKLLKLNREDRITLLFCGSKKSLVHGSVMASVLFSGSSYGSLFLVPIMIYHAFQLSYISVVARRYGREIEPV